MLYITHLFCIRSHLHTCINHQITIFRYFNLRIHWLAYNYIYFKLICLTVRALGRAQLMIEYIYIRIIKINWLKIWQIDVNKILKYIWIQFELIWIFEYKLNRIYLLFIFIIFTLQYISNTSRIIVVWFFNKYCGTSVHSRWIINILTLFPLKVVVTSSNL